MRRTVRCLRSVVVTPFTLLFFLSLGTSAPTHADAACTEECATTYWACSDACGAFGGALCEQNCSDAYNACSTYCSHCPSTRDYDTTQVNGKTLTGLIKCYRNTLNVDTVGHLYDQYTSNQTVYHWRETTQCNGSKSTQLLSTSPSNVTCWLRRPGNPTTCALWQTVALYACP